MSRIPNYAAQYLNKAKEIPPYRMQEHYSKAVTDGDIKVANAIRKIAAMQGPFATMSTSM